MFFYKRKLKGNSPASSPPHYQKLVCNLTVLNPGWRREETQALEHCVCWKPHLQGVQGMFSEWVMLKLYILRFIPKLLKAQGLTWGVMKRLTNCFSKVQSLNLVCVACLQTEVEIQWWVFFLHPLCLCNLFNFHTVMAGCNIRQEATI